MSEKIQKIFEKVADLGRYRIERTHSTQYAGRNPDAQEVTYPENRVELTEAQALDIARDILTCYNTKEQLIHAEQEWIMSGVCRTKEEVLVRDQSSAEVSDKTIDMLLEEKRKYVQNSETTVRILVAVLQRHMEDPNHFSRILMYVVAEELTKRFPLYSLSTEN